ncbi:RING-H2 finger protein ATL29-like [Glycine soja]|uniref:RING-type E3 ubiquitin transferase n=1 Tax=Glycine soja TaxID=3848 RepID=A0A0B2PBA0_GLYSO|nr:RING-H2 finger protein ATL29-like [Glycine soja]KAG5059134.1 hypothetical protein JHK87_000163 [Glycine soja]KHN04872.1 RING-H2 finger protein ATL29 [Glycine soja]RZC28020.1 RING-H2 finger protein ATL29 [Glycine soja]
MQTTKYDVFARLKANYSETVLPPPPPPPQITPSTLISFTVVVAVVCFVGFSILCFFRCCFVNISSTTLVHLSPNASPFRGLDPSQLQAFPTFLYATVKDLRKEKNQYSLECAICLLEFDHDSMLRLLTVCYHVFHQECIDLWLRSHKTCPVCRTDLDQSPLITNKSPEHQNVDNIVEQEISTDHHHVCIDVKEGDDSEGMQEQKIEFARSHSTGHSIVMVRGEGRHADKYTLRLPENVAFKIVKGGHNYSKSCSSSKDMARLAAPCRNCGYVQTVFQSSSSRSDIKNI